MCAEKVNVCSGGPTLIFACSGAADVGEVSDRAARKLTKEGAGAMFCLAGIGGRVEPIMKKTASASKILAIDGCNLDCVKLSLKQAGFNNFVHMRVTDLGMEKGKSPANEENINKAAAKGKELLG
ncbi:MAG: putative zinc-binding protein [Sedimentisphaerales bacterium]|nr:putative zinc-binding protein [Sedimentisphaerales bacterium]